MRRFPWAEVMQLGIATLHIPPRDFWNCTLRELVFLRSNKALERNGLEDLIKDWPDE